MIVRSYHVLPALRNIMFTVTPATAHVVKHPWSEFGDTEKHFRYACCVQSNSIFFIDDLTDMPVISSQVNKIQLALKGLKNIFT